MKLRNVSTYVVALFGMVGSMSGQDFTIHFKADNGADVSTYYVSANAIRRTSPGLNDVVDRMDRSTIIYLDHHTKSYKEVSAAEAREKIANGMANLDPQKKAMLHQMGLDAAPQLTKIGAGEIIAGYPTEKYSLKTGMAQGELWITQALQFPAAYYRDFNLLSGFAGPFSDGGKIAEVHGVILKRSMTGAMGHSINATGETAASVEKGSIPASMFEPPTDYKKVSGR
jgi:Domain of unknown function (DUF4412)